MQLVVELIFKSADSDYLFMETSPLSLIISLNCLALSRQASAFVFSAGVRGVLHLSSISFLHASKDVFMPEKDENNTYVFFHGWSSIV